MRLNLLWLKKVFRNVMEKPAMAEKDYYELLEININASQKEIEESYRHLAKKYHPDFYHDKPGQPYADELMKRINEAYKVLRSPQKRALYDAQIRKKYANKKISIFIYIAYSLFTILLAAYNYFSYTSRIDLGIEPEIFPLVLLIIMFLIALFFGILRLLEIFKKQVS